MLFNIYQQHCLDFLNNIGSSEPFQAMLFKYLNNVVENILNKFCLDTFLTVYY